jgi:cyanophycinase
LKELKSLLFCCLIACFLTAAPASAQTSIGPPKGALVIQGGGDILPEIWERFVSLAGGPDATAKTTTENGTTI